MGLYHHIPRIYETCFEDFSEDSVIPTFCLVTKSCKKDTAPEKWRKINVFGENEIVTTVEYGQAKYDFWAKNKAG